MKRGLPFALLLFIAGIASAVILSPAGPYIALILMISVVGVPFGLLLLAIPTAFLFLAISGCFWLLFGAGGWISRTAASLVAIAILTGIPQFVNHKFEADARLLAARDHDDVMLSGPVRSLAIIDPTRRGRHEPVCDELCKRILLNGNVDRLIIAMDDRTSPATDLRGRLYRRYQSDTCPVIDFDEGGNDLNLLNERFRSGDKPARDLLKLAAMNGHCIEISWAPVDSADAIIIRNSSVVDQPEVTGWDIWAQNMRSASLMAFQRNSGVLVETYRKTVVHYQTLFRILAPTVTGMAFNGFGSNAVGFGRQNAVLGANNIYEATPEIGPLLIDRLHFDLTLHQDIAAADARQLAATALRPTLSTGPDAAPAIAILFESIAMNGRPNPADLDIAAKLILSNQVELPYRLGPVVGRIIVHTPALATPISATLFQRLDKIIAKPSGALTRNDRYQFHSLADAIAVLPGTTVRDHFTVFDRIARDDKSRQIASPIFKHLPEFGPQGLVLALFLIEDAWRFRQPDDPVNDAWQAPYLAGLIAICRMASSAESALPQLEALLKQNHIAQFSGYKNLWEETLLRLNGNVDPKRHRACQF